LGAAVKAGKWKDRERTGLPYLSQDLQEIGHGKKHKTLCDLCCQRRLACDVCMVA